MKKTGFIKVRCGKYTLNPLPAESLQVIHYRDRFDHCLLFMRAMLFLLIIVVICIIQPRVALGESDQSGKCSIDTELNAVKDIVITRVETDGYSGSIHYETKNRMVHTMNLDQAKGGRMLPILTLVDNISMRLSDLQGAHVSIMKASRRECSISHPVIGNRHLSDQWIIRAELSVRN